jgi:alpha-beta hydrolase superfamily lysophospholipase
LQDAKSLPTDAGAQQNLDNRRISLSRSTQHALRRARAVVKVADGLRGLLALGLLVTGYALTRAPLYRESTMLADAGACRMEVEIAEPADGGGLDAVVLFHGLAANKKVMRYLARGFAAQGLRVYVPDLPGHGRTPGPFTPVRAEQCAESLVRGLSAHGLIDPQRTLLAGHSLGGVIAVRVAARVRVAGIIAISPAPMRATHGVSPEMLLFADRVALPSNSLIIAGRLEPERMRVNAAELLDTRSDDSSRYEEVPWASHVSLLFAPAAVRLTQMWVARILPSTKTPALPSLRGLLGAVMGFAGLLLLAGPFICEVVGRGDAPPPASERRRSSALRIALECAASSSLSVLLLKFWLPLRFVHLFEGDYLASFFLLTGALALLLHRKEVPAALQKNARGIPGAAFASLVLLLVVTGWLDLTVTEAWLTPARWMRFPIFLAAAFAFCLALEIWLGPLASHAGGRHLLVAGSLLLVMWLVLAGGFFFLHSGEVLVVLLAPYFAILFLFQRMGADLVYRETRSAAAAALFGAILVAGFCLALFPVA